MEPKEKPPKEKEIRLVPEPDVQPLPAPKTGGDVAPVSEGQSTEGDGVNLREADYEQLRDTLSAQQEKLIAAVIRDNVEYVTSHPTLKNIGSGELTVGEIGEFVKWAEKDPVRVNAAEDQMIHQVSRERDRFPNEWQWRGRRARYYVARAQLNKRINGTFGTELPVVDPELSEKSLREHHEK